MVCILSAQICVICERHWGFFFGNRLSTLAFYSLADNADLADDAEKDNFLIVETMQSKLFVVYQRNLRYLRENMGFMYYIYSA